MNPYMPVDRQDEDNLSIKDFDGEVLENDNYDDEEKE